jgi:NAD-reducing hydrogenase small subunit
MTSPTTRRRLATVWLEGCSGCHMSFLDLDERLLEVAELADLVHSPLVDLKEYPDGVDVCLVEGAVSTDADLERIRRVRARTKVLVSFGDCAVTTNVPGMRNPIGVRPLLERAYVETATLRPGPPTEVVPRHLPKALPVHKVVDVDVFLPGCPPSADLIHATLVDLLTREPDAAEPLPARGRFGA